MGWLLGPTLASFFLAVIVVKVFEYVIPGVMSSLMSVPKAGLFVVTWTAVTSAAGMRGFNQKVRRLRRGNQAAIKALSMGERP